MNRTTKYVIGAVALVALGWAAYAGLQPAQQTQSQDTGGGAGQAPGGKAAPAFKLASVAGMSPQVSLADYKGKVVLVNFWATWCPPCREEVPEFVKVQQELNPKGFTILGLSVDEDAKPVGEFITQNRINYPVAIDDGSASNAYGGITSIPTSFLVDRQGNIVQTFQGAIDADTLRKAVQPLL
jgi:cytochrome c biogenesis protein CcmG/thiol:disulfide interchange protein DsbE